MEKLERAQKKHVINKDYDNGGEDDEIFFVAVERFARLKCPQMNPSGQID